MALGGLAHTLGFQRHDQGPALGVVAHVTAALVSQASLGPFCNRMLPLLPLRDGLRFSIPLYCGPVLPLTNRTWWKGHSLSLESVPEVPCSSCFSLFGMLP